MRSLVIFGITALFLVCAFVPPSEANFKALAERGRIIVQERTKAAMLSGKIPSVQELKQAAAVMKSLASDPRITVIADGAVKGAKGQADAATLLKAASTLSSVLPTPSSIAQGAIHQVASRLSVKVSKRWTELLKTETDGVLLAQLERIDWAFKKNDVRLCGELRTHEPASPGNGITNTDLLALCLAKITREDIRCSQIGSTAAVLKSICEEELAVTANGWSGLSPI